jgi:Protein of unknown function (DUF3551)
MLSMQDHITSRRQARGRKRKDIQVSVFSPVLALAMAAIATVAATPAQAQTYDPRYPVCLQSYGIGGTFIDCSFTSMGQCAASASGRSAQCLENPYFARGIGPAPRRVGPRYYR